MSTKQQLIDAIDAFFVAQRPVDKSTNATASPEISDDLKTHLEEAKKALADPAAVFKGGKRRRRTNKRKGKGKKSRKY
jgi:hypothetical protein